MKIDSYLTFSGNCHEAMTFYKECLGGKLFFQTIGESPMAAKMPETIRHYILHSTLTNGPLTILASDMVGNKGLIKGNSVSLVLNCDSESEIKQCFEKLSEGGEKTHPLEHTFFGALLGNVSDKFGNHWLLIFQKTNN